MILRFLEYNEKNNTLLAEGIIGGVQTRLQLLVSRRTVATDLLSSWEKSFAKVSFNTAGWMAAFAQPTEDSGGPSKISKLVFLGLQRKTGQGPRHIVFSGETEDETVFFALASRRLGKRLTPGTPVLSLLVDHKGEVCDVLTEPSVEVTPAPRRRVPTRTLEG